MKNLSAVKTVEKKSRFYAYLYELSKKEDINEILKFHRKKYKKANHHCYSLTYKLNEEFIETYKDDGEVGHPGKILLEILKKHGLNHHCLVVSRIFGGIKLGVGGVSKEFKKAGESAVKHYKNKIRN